MRVNHVGIGRQSVVETIQSADTVKTIVSSACMRMESVRRLKSKF